MGYEDEANMKQAGEGRDVAGFDRDPRRDRVQPNTVMGVAGATRSELDNLSKELEALNTALEPVLGEGPKSSGGVDGEGVARGGYSTAVNLGLENWYYIQSLTERIARLRSRLEL